ncbi:MAG: MFS transporter [Quadrisphaera sp.]
MTATAAPDPRADELEHPGKGCFSEPTAPVGPRFTTALVAAQLLFFIALLGPAIVGIAVKVNTIVPEAGRTEAVAFVAAFGAAAAFLANVVFGRLSDRTTSRWGRRRPWIVGGTVVMTLAFVVMALGADVATVTAGWFLAQAGANAALAPFVATLADQVPQLQRGKVAAVIGMAQNVGIYGGTLVAQFFQGNLLLMFVGPALLAVVAMTVYAVVLPDQVLPTKPARMGLREWARTFWVSPRRHPDFALAWWSRFLITLATFMFTTFRLFYMEDRIGLDAGSAVAAVSTGGAHLHRGAARGGAARGLGLRPHRPAEGARGGFHPRLRRGHGDAHPGQRRQPLLPRRGGARAGLRHLRRRGPGPRRRRAARPRRLRQGPRRLQHGQRPAPDPGPRSRRCAAGRGGARPARTTTCCSGWRSRRAWSGRWSSCRSGRCADVTSTQR